jgi:hypothetical protein
VHSRSRPGPQNQLSHFHNLNNASSERTIRPEQTMRDGPENRTTHSRTFLNSQGDLITEILGTEATEKTK